MASETHGADAAHAGNSMGEAFPPFDVATFQSQLFWLAIAFVLLYVLLSYVVLPKLGGMIEERKNKIDSDLDEAARMKAEADASIVEMDKQLAVARAEARASAEKTRSEIDQRISAASAAKNAELDQTLSEAEARIEEMKAAAMANVSDIAREATATILAQLGTKATPKQIESSVSKSIDEMMA